MEFIQGDILDKKLIKELFKNAHVVHHLAGITNVPRTKNESNIELNKNQISWARGNSKYFGLNN